jgi:DNA-binding MarR family transcriptional regulator/GNAT superfamily N-acetyltransferase
MEGAIPAVRRFNRFYTRRIGVLEEELLESPFSLAEARVLYEIAQGARPTASGLGRQLGLDAGYLSRILRGFTRRGLLRREASEADGRQSHLSLTAKGRGAFADLDRRSERQIRSLLRALPAGGEERLREAMRTIEELLGDPRPPASPVVLRSPEPGDLGWVVHRHGLLYAREWGYDREFEGLVAGIVAHFVEAFDPRKERCWIAERDGRILGSVFLVKKTATVAKLRLLLLEPEARGQGLGARLVDECVRFARQAGYRRITLWTQSHLRAARRLYEQAGFVRTLRKSHRSFGRRLVAETWELRL